MLWCNKNAFTLIELIVVVTIIVITSSSGILYFSDFIWNQELKQELYVLESNIKSLDNDVRKYKIFDYELHINSLSWSQAYTYYTNKFDVPNPQLINFDSVSMTWTISISWSPSSLWNIKIYKNDKLLSNQISRGDKNYIWFFSQNTSITSYLSWESLNNIYINYFANSSDKNYIELTWINSQENKGGIAYSNLKIVNIWWKKEIFWDSSLLNDAYLFFENKWIESFIKITK